MNSIFFNYAKGVDIEDLAEGKILIQVFEW